jgi:hypothetical protein
MVILIIPTLNTHLLQQDLEIGVYSNINKNEMPKTNANEIYSCCSCCCQKKEREIITTPPRIITITHRSPPQHCPRPHNIIIPSVPLRVQTWTLPQTPTTLLPTYLLWFSLSLWGHQNRQANLQLLPQPHSVLQQQLIPLHQPR